MSDGLCGFSWRGRGRDRLTCALPEGHENENHMTQKAIDASAAPPAPPKPKIDDELSSIRAFLLGGPS